MTEKKQALVRIVFTIAAVVAIGWFITFNILILGRIEEGSDADIVVWNPNNVRNIKNKSEETESKADVNVLDGLTLHGAPEFVIANGRVILYEYEMNPGISQVGAKILNTDAFPSIFYDQVQDLDDLGKIVGKDGEWEG